MTEPSPVSGVNFRQITANGLDFRIAVAGDSGPLMLLAHGWPESWYSWRHQLQFFSHVENLINRWLTAQNSIAN